MESYCKYIEKLEPPRHMLIQMLVKTIINKHTNTHIYKIKITKTWIYIIIIQIKDFCSLSVRLNSFRSLI